MKPVVLITALFLTIFTNAQQTYWQQRTDYVIDVTLNDSLKTLDAFEKITYTNNSPDTLRFIWFHLWPNAYKNDQTTFSEQMLRNSNTDFYFSDKEQRGYINRLDFRVNGVVAKTEDHPSYIDVVKLILPKPLPPGETTMISTPFHVKLPFNFSRGGYDRGSFQLTQWYPKPAVYDKNGWHPIPYLDQGEFYSEFGKFDVTIHAERDFMIAATGKLLNDTGNGYMAKDFRTTNSDRRSDIIDWQFRQDSVHDFAWFADKHFIGKPDTCMLPGGKIIQIIPYYTHTEEKYWSKSVQYAKDAVRFYSLNVGEYPYEFLRIVQGPQSFGGGMEYPTITIISPVHSDKELDVTIAHEIGHNWFYGILASDERTHPWMDEGINSFYERKYTREKYGSITDAEELIFQTLVHRKKDQPIETTAAGFTELNYAMVAYHKTAVWLEYIENRIGEEKFRQMMREYYDTWKFKHPQPEDFDAILKKYSGEESRQIIALRDQQGIIPGKEPKGTGLVSPLIPSSFKNYFKHPYKNAFLISPAIGVNSYDGVMVGGLFSNYKLPPSRLQFVAAPLYGTRSGSLNGIGRVEYNSYPSKTISHFQLNLTYSTFSCDLFKDEKGKNHFSRFAKLSPGLKFGLKEKDLHSTKSRYFEWKSYFINEQPFYISYDSLISPTDTVKFQVVSKTKLDYQVHRLSFHFDNDRTLYPYSLKFMAEGSADFLRLTAEGNYFFNYKDGGLSMRVFAGKFFYDNGKTYPYGFNIERYFLDLSGRNGYEDYTYSEYFAGRNEFQGFRSRQISINDGGFKIRTDLYSQPVGLSDDWLASINLNSSVPAKINPLSVLPVKIPIHVFLDLGTFSGRVKNESASGRFLYDAGIHFPLFGGVINFYFPLIYSSEYKDYVRSVYEKNRLIKASTFSIDLKKMNTLVRKTFML